MQKYILEKEVLLSCLGETADEDIAAQLKQLSLTDWEKVIQMSIRHGVTPLLYQRVKKIDALHKNLPDSVRERLRALYLQSFARNSRLCHELSKVLTLLREEDIPVIVLKGMHLDEIVYGNIGLRTIADVDLLFRREDLRRAQQALVKAGYSPRNSSIPLDIHWGIDLSNTGHEIDMEGVWHRAQPATIAGVKVLVLSPTDLLLHLCLHLSIHHLFEFGGLRTLCDIREIIQHYEGQISWIQLRRSAEAWGIINSVYLTFLLAREMLGAQIPKDLVDGLKPEEFSQEVKDWAAEQIFHEGNDPVDLSPYFWYLWKPGSFRKKLVNLRRLLLPAPEFVSQKYQSPYGTIRNYLQYITRLREHFLRYIRVIWRIVIRDEEMLVLVKRQCRNIDMREWLSSK